MSFRVDLESYRGPLDLLLFLVRKHEVDILDIPIAMIAQQYAQHLEVLKELDVNLVGDFLEMASILMEIKSRSVLPRTDESHELLEDPREELVQRLLEYKKYKDAASMLEERSRQWQQCYTRLADDMPQRSVEPADQPIHEVELWDMVSAFGRVMRENEISKPSNIVYDETPIHVFMEDIHERVAKKGRMAFSETFELGMHKSALIGAFLALLELVRHHRVNAEQGALHGEIWILPGPNFSSELDVSQVETYDHQVDPAEDPPAKPR